MVHLYAAFVLSGCCMSPTNWCGNSELIGCCPNGDTECLNAFYRDEPCNTVIECAANGCCVGAASCNPRQGKYCPSTNVFYPFDSGCTQDDACQNGCCMYTPSSGS